MLEELRCELCPRHCRLMDINCELSKKFEIIRCNDESAMFSIKIKECKAIHKFTIKDKTTDQYLFNMK